jgi:hypothetical protein
MEKRKLQLSALEGNPECFLEIGLFGQGDMRVGMRGQTTDGEVCHVSAQICNPVNGGGNLEDYKTLSQIYKILEKTRK